jgi:hypothetical protein
MRREILKHPSIAARASEWSADSTALVEIIRAMPQVSAALDMTARMPNPSGQLSPRQEPIWSKAMPMP